jgi:DNA-binding GntR family transcriptional regulator
MEAISDLPMLHDIDADYAPQYVKLARILRDKIKSGELRRFTSLPAPYLTAEYHVSTPVAYAALEMLAANRYVGRPKGTRSYRVTWTAFHPDLDAGVGTEGRSW